MIDNLGHSNIRIFVFGTLRKGEYLDYYMDGSDYKGLYYCRGQLMKAENGSVYIDFKYKDAFTIGELHHVNFACLRRINHLESKTIEFPKGYDLSVLPIWEYKPDKKITFDITKSKMALYYRRRNEPVKIIGGDFTKQKDAVYEIGEYLKNSKDKIENEENIIDFMKELLKTLSFGN